MENEKKASILLMDDEDYFLQGMKLSLQSRGYLNVHLSNSPIDFFSKNQNFDFDLAVLDINMPGMTGLEVLKRLKAENPDLPVIMVTAVTEIEMVVDCMRAGAINYLLKPLEEEQFFAQLHSVLEFSQLQSENIALRNSLLEDKKTSSENFKTIITQNEKMSRIFKYIEAVAPTPFPVLITGETGVGKEALAASIHACSNQSGKFVAVNVAGLDDTLFSDTLFGHLKGAYTSAEGSRIGLVEKANGGTLFLDEIGDLSQSSQLKLLRLLQTGDFYPLGSDTARKADVRVVVATNRELGSREECPDFRRDLYFRLRTHRIHLPALRDRQGDIIVLARHFAHEFSVMMGLEPLKISETAERLLSDYSFPGNIRELQSLIYDVASQSESEFLDEGCIRNYIEMEEGFQEKPESDSTRQWNSNDFPTMKMAIRNLIEQALRISNGKQSSAAEMLGISRQALNKRIRSWDSSEEFE